MDDGGYRRTPPPAMFRQSDERSKDGQAGFAAHPIQRRISGPQLRHVCLTPAARSGILETVVSFGRSLSAFFLVLALSASNVAACAGWLATPEARMACCTEGGACLMHKAESDDSGSPRAITQAEADSCCAASEQEDPAPSSSIVVFSVTLAVIPSPVPFVSAITAAQSDRWRRIVPVPGARLPKHLRLSVLLV